MQSKQVAQKETFVVDSFGTKYQLIKSIGEGGQGKVLTTAHPNMLVKISRGIKQQDVLKQRRSQIERVIRSPLRDLRIALPSAVLSLPSQVGYVMELMDGLEPLSEQIERIYTEDGLSVQKYRDTGSLSRRLLILKELAETLAKLHGRGYAFGDLSPSNIFISKSVDYHQVWLIDSDNISISEQLNDSQFYTPGYGAPEIIRGESGSNTCTDSWSFAVIALQILAHIHPYNSGIAVEDEEPEVAEEQSAQGEYPWIFDEEDDSNEWAGSGIPILEFINSDLASLFQRCFSLSRIHDGIIERPSMAEWHLELHKIIQLLLKCQNPDCYSDFVAQRGAKTCPFCDSKLAEDQYLHMSLWGYDSENMLGQSHLYKTDEELYISQNQEKPLYIEPYSIFDIDELKAWCSLKVINDCVEITPHEDKGVYIFNSAFSKFIPVNRKQILRKSSSGEKRSVYLTHSSLVSDVKALDGLYWRIEW